MTMSLDLARRRLQDLSEVCQLISTAAKRLEVYAGTWGSDGFVHTFSEIVGAARQAGETSCQVLEGYIAVKQREDQQIPRPEASARDEF